MSISDHSPTVVRIFSVWRAVPAVTLRRLKNPIIADVLRLFDTQIIISASSWSHWVPLLLTGEGNMRGDKLELTQATVSNCTPAEWHMMV